MLIDVHCHLTGNEYETIGDVEDVLRRASDAGVHTIICSAFDLESSYQSARLCERFDNLYFCAGFHPGELHGYHEGDLDKLAPLLRHEKCVAVGEIGLDYHFDNNPSKELQKEIFVKQLHLAKQAGLPVVLHSRDAAQDTVEILEAYAHCLQKGGLLHCYSYSPEMVDRFLKLGLYFSFGGTATFKNAKKVWDSVQRIPAPRILTETDSPYLTPVPFRGVFPNEPKNVKHVIAKLADLREVDERTLEKQIYENAKTLFFKMK